MRTVATAFGCIVRIVRMSDSLLRQCAASCFGYMEGGPAPSFQPPLLPTVAQLSLRVAMVGAVDFNRELHFRVGDIDWSSRRSAFEDESCAEQRMQPDRADGDSVSGKLEARVPDRAADPVAALTDAGIGEAHHGDPRHPERHADLDVDRAGLDAEIRPPSETRQQPNEATASGWPRAGAAFSIT
jgi:hypothetical protein